MSSSPPVSSSQPAPSPPPPSPPLGRWARVQPWVSLVLRLGLAGVALWAGVAKLLDPQASVRAVAAYDLLPASLETIVGYGLPALEVIVGLLLLVGLLTRYAALANAVFMLAFVVGVASAWARGLSIDCGCFGGGGEVDPDETQYVQVLVRDGLLLVASLVLARWPRSPWSADAALRLA